jgi:hypothetical protein
MSEQQYAPDGTPSIEVRVYRHGDLIERRMCESEEEAAAVVEEWSELDDVSCLVDDLSFHHAPGDVLEPEPTEVTTEDYPREPTTEP